MNRRTALAFTAFVAVVIFTNWITAELGFVTWFGIAATAGTWFAGFGLVARDYLNEAARPHAARWIIAAILTGSAASLAMALTVTKADAAFLPPGVTAVSIALASCAAFLCSEFADWAVYSRLRRKGMTRAAIGSNVVGAVIDSILFLWLAGFTLELGTTTTQVLVKVGTTTVFVLGVRLVVSRQSVLAGRRDRNV